MLKQYNNQFFVNWADTSLCRGYKELHAGFTDSLHAVVYLDISMCEAHGQK